MQSWIIWRRCCVLLCRSKKEVSETYCIFSLICYNWGYKLLSTKGIIMEWESYWDNLIEKKKLRPRLDELDELDKARCNPYTTEQICHKIYDDYYRIWRPKWKQVRDHFWELVEQFQGVHLQTSRIKTLDSLLVKVICKRHEHLGDPDSLYFKIDGENYREIITDLIGMRLIINYRGKWEMIHNEIVQHFPYVEEKLYDEYDLIPMDKLDKNALVQIPTIY